MDWLDEQLSQMPSPMPSLDLDRRICLALRARERARRFSHLVARIGWTALLLGFVVSALLMREILNVFGNDLPSFFGLLGTALNNAWNALLAADFGLLTALWTALQDLSLTALSLALSFLVVGASLMAAAQIARTNLDISEHHAHS